MTIYHKYKKQSIPCKVIANPQKKDPNDLLREGLLLNLLLEILKQTSQESAKDELLDLCADLCADLIARIGDEGNWRLLWAKMEAFYHDGTATELFQFYQELKQNLKPSQARLGI